MRNFFLTHLVALLRSERDGFVRALESMHKNDIDGI